MNYPLIAERALCHFDYRAALLMNRAAFDAGITDFIDYLGITEAILEIAFNL